MVRGRTLLRRPLFSLYHPLAWRVSVNCVIFSTSLA